MSVLYQTFLFCPLQYIHNVGSNTPRSGVFFLLINNSMKLKYEVILLVHKPQSKIYISSVVFVINLNCIKNIVSFYNSKTGAIDSRTVFV